MSGVYNLTYFNNHPDEKDRDGVLYCVVLVNLKTNTRECLKIGIASGKNWKDVLKRSRGFTGYDIRIQKTYHDTLYNVWSLNRLFMPSLLSIDTSQLKSLEGILSASKYVKK